MTNKFKNINQLKAGATLTYITIGLGYVISLAYTPIMLRLLGQSEYGLYNLVASVVAYLGLLNFGFGSAYMRFFSRYKVSSDRENIAKLNGMFLIIFVTLGLVSFAAGMILVQNTSGIFGSKLTNIELEKAKILMLLMVINLALNFPNVVFNSHISANEKFIFQKVLQLIKTIVNPFVVIPILMMGYGSVGMVVVATVLNLGIEIANIIFCFKKLDMQFSFKRFDFVLMKEMIVFSSFIFIYIIIDQVNWNVDKFILGRFHGTVTVAIYGLATQLNVYFMSIATAISNVFTPRVHKMVAMHSSDTELTTLFTKVGRVQFSFVILVLLGFYTFGQAFINLWAGKIYSEAYYVAVLLMTPMAVPLIQNIGIEIRKAKNKHKAPTVVMVFVAILNVLVSIPLAREYGAVGSTIGTALSILVNGIIINIYYHKVIGLNIMRFWNQIFNIAKGAILPAFLAVLIHITMFGQVSDVVYMIMIIPFCGFFLLSMYLFGFNEYEKNLIINDMIKRIFKKR